MSNTLVYTLEDKIYINLTNSCTNKCVFCLRQDKSDVCGQEMWLDSEIFGADSVIEQLENKNYDFCGYVDSPFVMYNGVQIVGNESSLICLDQETINLQRTREILLKQFKNLLDLCYQVDYQKLQNYK